MATRYAELVGRLNKFGEHLLPAAEEYSDELTTLSQAAAAITALEAALKPFAEAAESIDDDVPDRAEMWEHPASMQVTAGDFRRAASIESKP